MGGAELELEGLGTSQNGSGGLDFSVVSILNVCDKIIMTIY